jgi:hypothetical protein
MLAEQHRDSDRDERRAHQPGDRFHGCHGQVQQAQCSVVQLRKFESKPTSRTEDVKPLG